MKKIYLSLVGLSFCGATFAQNAVQAEGGSLPFNAQKFGTKAVVLPPDAAAASKPFAYWIDPVGDMIFNKGIGIYDADASKNLVGGYVTPLFCDSTVKYQNADASFSTVNTNFLGVTLDPQSQYLLEQGGGAPVVTASDPYTVDSISILTRYYMKDTTKHDTLFIYLQWGKPDNANVYSSIASSTLYGTDFAGFRTNYTCVKVKGASGTPGPVVTSDAPSTNYKLIKYALKKSDTVLANNYAVYLQLKIDNVTIPAGNIVSLYYTYVPQAGSTKLGDVYYSFAATKAAVTVNGFGAQIWQQKGIATTADYKDYMIDPTSGHSGGLSYSKTARYGLNATRKNVVYNYPGLSPIINIKITGNSSVGINELNNNFSLEQNAPNPFNNETTISYQLKTSAKNVSVAVYNVAGVKVFENAQVNTAAGRYSVKVDNSNLAAGVYFYSLIVDGNQATKKMVVTE